MKVGAKIKKRREKLGYSQKKLAAMCGWKYQRRVSEYENDLRPIPTKFIPVIETALQAYPGWLLDEFADESALVSINQDGNISSNVRVIPVRQMPIFTLEEFVMQSLGKLAVHATNEAIPVYNTSPTYKAIQVSGDAMESPSASGPSFKSGDIIFVDDGQKIPAPGNFVIAIIDEKDTAVFKQYVEDAGRAYLKSINPAYPSIPFDHQKMKIIAVAVRKYAITELI